MDNSGVRLPDLARAAGVSVATVSRVLGGRGHVAESTAAKVRDAVERLGYARSTLLDRASARLIAIASPPGPAGWQLETARALTNAVAAAGHVPLLGSSGDAACAVWLGFDEPELPRGHPAPVVRLVAGTGETPAGLPAAEHSVTIAVGAGIRAALVHLAALGHRRVGLIRPDGAFGDACEFSFLRDHPSAAHMAPGHLARWIVTTPDDEAAAGRSMSRLLDSTCTAVVCGTDRQLFGAMDGVRNLKLAAPRDVSLVGIGDDPRMPFTAPAATTVRFDPPPLAGQLCDAALASLGLGSPHPSEASAELIVRASTGPARGTR